jgi:hypothetical protein
MLYQDARPRPLLHPLQIRPPLCSCNEVTGVSLLHGGSIAALLIWSIIDRDFLNHEC